MLEAEAATAVADHFKKGAKLSKYNQLFHQEIDKDLSRIGIFRILLFHYPSLLHKRLATHSAAVASFEVFSGASTYRKAASWRKLFRCVRAKLISRVYKFISWA